MKTKLWNRNFICAVSGMVISALGGVGLNVALGIIIFSETQSTILSAIFISLSLIPQLVVPIVAGSLIDRRNPLNVLITNELLLAAGSIVAGAVTYFYGFSYALFLVFSLLLSCFGVISHLASQSIIPQIMSKDNYVRGNAIINIIYPFCSIVVAPIAVLIYTAFGIAPILFAFGILCVIDVAIESRIKVDFVFIESAKSTFRDYAGDLKEAAAYMMNNRGVRSVLFFFSLVMLSTASYEVLLYPLFSRSETLTDNQYALLASIASAGYLVGGLLHYFIRIPDNRRYMIAVAVYLIFVGVDAVFFIFPYPLMCASRFLLGILGMNSANIRVSAIQAEVPNILRAKVNALFLVMTSASLLVGHMAAGALGEYLPYWLIQMSFQGFYLFGILFFVLPPRNKVRELYNYSTETVNCENSEAK